MSYLTQISPAQPPRSADDFQCGWSVISMLAGLSLKAPAEVPAARPKQEIAAAIVAPSTRRRNLPNTERA